MRSTKFNKSTIFMEQIQVSLDLTVVQNSAYCNRPHSALFTISMVLCLCRGMEICWSQVWYNTIYHNKVPTCLRPVLQRLQTTLLCRRIGCGDMYIKYCSILYHKAVDLQQTYHKQPKPHCQLSKVHHKSDPTV